VRLGDRRLAVVVHPLGGGRGWVAVVVRASAGREPPPNGWTTIAPQWKGWGRICRRCKIGGRMATMTERAGDSVDDVVASYRDDPVAEQPEELRRIMSTGTIWPAAAVIAPGLVLG